MKPLIGITMNLEEQATRDRHDLDLDYGKAVVQAGGIPVPILGIDQAVPDLIRQLDGFLFSGGGDISPRFYKERQIAGARLRLDSDRRVKFEIRLFKEALRAKKPVLAVCYGAQLANVALGGTLYQDIGLQIPGAMKHGPGKKNEKVFHRVNIFEGTRLCDVLGKCATGDCEIRVRSSHHQSFKNPGRGLRLAAVSADGVFEALESRGKHYLIAVQWHPEKTLNDGPSRRLFESLVRAARR